jgi:hypothetical protein
MSKHATLPQRRFAENEKDVGNVEAWAEIIGDLLHHVPLDKRREVLALAIKNEQAAAEEREANGGFKFMTFSDDWMNTPGQRQWNVIMRLKSLLVQVFVRNITNNHSPQEAASILFAQHPHGTGSRVLQDYLCDLCSSSKDA